MYFIKTTELYLILLSEGKEHFYAVDAVAV